MFSKIKKKAQRTEEFETAVKVQNMEDMVAEEIQEMTENLRQKRFDNLISRGIICLDKSDCIEVNAEDVKFEGDFTL